MIPGILPNLQGGIGNQMFMIVASFVVAKTLGCPLYILDKETNNPHVSNGYNYNTLIFNDFGIILKELDTSTYTSFTQISEEGYHPSYNPWNISDVKVGSIMVSNFQYYPPFLPFEDEIREKFLKALEPFSPKEDYSKKAFLHIRRGDYLDNPLYHYIQPLEYYIKAVKQLMGSTKPEKIIVISDDMEWVDSQGFFRQPIFEIFKGDELETLALMSKCVKGSICANSTFSWWGAFLGSHALRNPVYVPENWIDIPIFSLFPEEWIII